MRRAGYCLPKREPAMKRVLEVIFGLFTMAFVAPVAELTASTLFLTLLFGGILAIGISGSGYVSYWLAAVRAIGWAT